MTRPQATLFWQDLMPCWGKLKIERLAICTGPSATYPWWISEHPSTSAPSHSPHILPSRHTLSHFSTHLGAKRPPAILLPKLVRGLKVHSGCGDLR